MKALVTSRQSPVVELQVPEESTLLGIRDAQKRAVSLLQKGTDLRIFWLHVDDVEWLVGVMIQEYDLRGVPVVDKGPASDAGRQAPAADPGGSASSTDLPPAACQIKWNFDHDCWEATIQTPAAAGPKKCFVAHRT